MLNHIDAISAVSIDWSSGAFCILPLGSIYEREYVDQAERPATKTQRIVPNYRDAAVLTVGSASCSRPRCPESRDLNPSPLYS